MRLPASVLSVRLAPEYACSPVWLVFDDGVLDVPVDELPISADLQRLLNLWDDAYQATYQPSDPSSSGFASDDAEAAFWQGGRQVLSELRAELPGVQVEPCPELGVP